MFNQVLRKTASLW